MQRVLIGAVLVAFALDGCASAPPRSSVHVYPAKGQSAAKQSRDTTECQNWAKQETGHDPALDTAKGAGVGAAIGALAGAAGGAAIGAATGNAGQGAAIGAAAGGVTGAVGGGAYNYSKTRDGYDQAFSACMTGRGYSVR
jgi:phage tail tape-measure protein